MLFLIFVVITQLPKGPLVTFKQRLLYWVINANCNITFILVCCVFAKPTGLLHFKKLNILNCKICCNYILLMLLPSRNIKVSSNGNLLVHDCFLSKIIWSEWTDQTFLGEAVINPEQMWNPSYPEGCHSNKDIYIYGRHAISRYIWC